MWRITTQEVELREGQEDFLELGPDDSVDDGEFDQLLVLIEDLHGRAESFEIDITAEGEIEASEPRGPSRVFFGSVGALAGVSVRIRARVSGFFRVTIARLKKHLRERWDELPCDICKALAKTLARAILAWFGVGMPTDVEKVGDALAGLDLPSLVEVIGKSPLWRWIARSGLEALAMALLGPLFFFLRQVRETEEWIYVQACIAVGACSPK